MITALEEYRQNRTHELCHTFKIIVPNDSNEQTSEYVTNMFLWIQENLERKTYHAILTINGLNPIELVGMDIEFYNEITAIGFKLTWE